MQRLTVFVLFLCLFFSFASHLDAEDTQDELYRVGIDDLLDITVIGHPDLSMVTAVTQDGTIAFHHLGTVYVKNLKLDEIEEIIERRLSEGYIKYPSVTVSLASARSRKIFVYGALGRRGEVPVEDNMTLLNAISLAGGITNEGLFGKLVVKRKKSKSRTYEDIIETHLNNGYIDDKRIANTVIYFNDIIVVEPSKTFLMQGEVASRGRLVLEKDMTLLRAVSLAGGVSQNGHFGKVKIRRKQKNSQKYKDIVESALNDGVIEDRNVENTLLQADDIVIVERSKSFLTQGEIASRGRFILEKDMTLLRAISLAGGVTQNGMFGKVKIRRKVGDSDEYTDVVESALNDGVIEDKKVEKMVLQPNDVLIVERSKTYLIQGEVASRGRFALEKDMTVLRAILHAGGVTNKGLNGKITVRRKMNDLSDEYVDVMEASLEDGIIDNKNLENMVLQVDDIIIVKGNKTFLLYGEVNRPGEYILEPNMTVFNAIIISGGFTKWGSTNKVKILRQAEGKKDFSIIKIDVEKVIKGDATKDIRIQEGDIIVVSTGIL